MGASTYRASASKTFADPGRCDRVGPPLGSPANVGQALFSAENVLTLEVISILLIAAMVGVMVLAKGLRYDSQAGDTEGEREA